MKIGIYFALKYSLISFFGGSIVLVGKILLGLSSTPLDLFFLYFGAFCGSLAVDIFRWFRHKRKECLPPLQDDVIEAINKIYERNIDYSPMERGYINAKRWTLPLDPDQEKQLNKVFNVKNN